MSNFTALPSLPSAQARYLTDKGRALAQEQEDKDVLVYASAVASDPADTSLVVAFIAVLRGWLADARDEWDRERRRAALGQAHNNRRAVTWRGAAHRWHRDDPEQLLREAEALAAALTD